MISRFLLVLLLLCSLTAADAYLTVYGLRASGLRSSTDGYVQAYLNNVPIGYTSVRNNNRNPWWEDEIVSYDAKVGDVLRLEVRDLDVGFDDMLGYCERSIQLGTYQYSCSLFRGATLDYSYRLD